MRQGSGFVAVLVLAAGLILLLLAVADGAAAHPKPKSWGSGVPGIHKICSAIGVCSDRAPRPGPQHDCTPARNREVVPVWDERLGAYVNWECRCDDEGDCRWFRLGIVHRAKLPWEACWRYVIDFHRACASIVCNYVAREHRYPVKRNAFWCG